MGSRDRIVGALLVAAAMAVVGAGCGGGSDASSGSTSNASENTTSENSSGPEPSAEFDAKGSNAKIVNFGQEADPAEREAASKVLEKNMQAREDAEWGVQCSTLSAGAIKQLAEEAAKLNVKGGCPKSLEYGAEPANVTEAIRANTMTGPIDALRVKGNKAWALYHGTEGKDYAVEMVKEGGEWKVVPLVTTELR